MFHRLQALGSTLNRKASPLVGLAELVTDLLKGSAFNEAQGQDLLILRGEGGNHILEGIGSLLSRGVPTVALVFVHRVDGEVGHLTLGLGHDRAKGGIETPPNALDNIGGELHASSRIVIL